MGFVPKVKMGFIQLMGHMHISAESFSFSLSQRFMIKLLNFLSCAQVSLVLPNFKLKSLQSTMGKT